MEEFRAFLNGHSGVFATWLTGLALALCLGLSTPAMAQGSGAKLLANGEKALASGEYDSAADQLTKAIKSGSLAKPDMAKAFVSRGKALQGKGSHARAVADFTNALWLESLPSSATAEALALRGTSQQVLGQTKAASDDFKKAEAAQPGITSRLGGAASAAASAPAPRTASRPANDSGGFLNNIFGGSDDSAAATPTRSRVATSRTPTTRSAPAPRSNSSGESSSVGDFFSNIFGGSDDADDAPRPVAAPTAPVERRRLTAADGATSNPSTLTPSTAPAPSAAPASGPRQLLRPGGENSARQRIEPSSNAAPPPVANTQRSTSPTAGRLLGDGEIDPDGPEPAPRRTVARRVDDEPGFFERIFSGSGSDAEPASARSQPASSGRLRPASANQDAWRTVAQPRAAAPAPAPTPVRAPRAAADASARSAPAPATQRDTSLPTFVNQPRMTDRILANDRVEPGVAGGTRLAALEPQRPRQQTGVRAAPPARTVTTVPAAYDWTETTRVERGSQAGRVVRQPVPTRASPPQPVVRRTREAPTAATPAPRPARAAAPRPTRDSGTLGSTVASAVDWIGERLTFGGGDRGEVPTAANPRPTRTVAPAPRRPAARSAPRQASRQTARTSYRAPKPSAGGGYVVQLAARQRRSDAEAAARGVTSRHRGLFGGAKPYIARADIPGKGTFYRVRVGPYRTRAQVASLCGQLKSRGQECFATRN